MKQNVFSFFKRAGFLYVIALLIFYKGTDIYLMKVKTINHVVPQSMAEQAAFMFHPHFDQGGALEQAINYHKTVVKLVPDSWSDWGFLGYAYFFNGDMRRAKLCFLKADVHEKDFFWYSYDLGMVYLREGQYDLAGQAFAKSISTDFPRTLYLMHAYKAYNLLMPEVLTSGYSVEAGLYSAVKNAQAMLAVCHYRLPIDKNDPKYFPRMF